MDHIAFITHPDGTQITFSEVYRENEEDKIKLYYERPNKAGDDFDSFAYVYSDNIYKDVVGYIETELKQLTKKNKKLSELLLGWNREGILYV